MENRRILTGVRDRFRTVTDAKILRKVRKREILVIPSLLPHITRTLPTIHPCVSRFHAKGAALRKNQRLISFRSTLFLTQSTVSFRAETSVVIRERESRNGRTIFANGNVNLRANSPRLFRVRRRLAELRTGSMVRGALIFRLARLGVN